MSYAKTNLKDLEDSAAKAGLSEIQEARFARQALDAEQTGLNYMIVKPGKREAFAHKHRTAEELYVILSGTGRIRLDDDIVELAAHDAVRVSPGTVRCLEGGPDGLELLVFGPHAEKDGEIVKDFWTD